MIKKSVVGWLPHSNNPVFAGVRYRFVYPMRSLLISGMDVECFDFECKEKYSVVIIQAKWVLGFNNPKVLLEKINIIISLKEEYGTKIIVDSCDNYFHNPDHDKELQEKIDCLLYLMSKSDCLVAASKALATKITEICNREKDVVVIGDAVERLEDVYFGETFFKKINIKRWRAFLDAYLHVRYINSRRKNGYKALVWFGNHGTISVKGGMEDLLLMKEDIEKYATRNKVVLTIISNSEAKYLKVLSDWDVETKYIEWNRATFHYILQNNDVAVIPASLNEFSKYKGNNRLVVSLYLGLGVVASEIESYQSFKDYCHIGKTDEFENYVDDKETIKLKCIEAKKIIEKCWTVNAIAKQWEKVIDSA